MEGIAFLSLLLGLVVGEYDVELMVSDQVASVEILLDGELVQTLDGPPWWTRCDFGEQLQPHLLVAVARDDEGKEMERAQQWVNLPRGHVDVSMLLGGSPDDGESRTVRLSWQSIHGTAPSSVAVSFDGEPLVGGSTDSIKLPKHDPRRPHLVLAELDFGWSGKAVAEVVLGGGFDEQLRTELTAVPVELTGSGSLPRPERMAGWFLDGDAPVEVLQVERGMADVVMIMDTASRVRLYQMVWDHIAPLDKDVTHIDGRFLMNGRYGGPRFSLNDSESLWVMAPAAQVQAQIKDTYEIFDLRGPYSAPHGEIMLRVACLGPEALAELASAVATGTGASGTDQYGAVWTKGGQGKEALGGAQGSADAELPEQIKTWWVHVADKRENRLLPTQQGQYVEVLDIPIEMLETAYDGPDRLADAVASAGRFAVGRGRRRAVVLVRSGDEPDGSRLTPQIARHYLEQLHLPLEVWTVTRRPGDQESPWGEVEQIKSLDGFADALHRLYKSLARQRVVWLDGAHLPQDITLSDKAQRIRLAQ